MPGIFICYRRADAEGWAGRLSDSLKAELGRINIFRDIDDIPPGVEFDTYINEAVGSCGVLIALIGPRWLTVTDKTGSRRVDDPKDFIHLEILTALKRNIRVIPALVGGMTMPDADELPEDLKPLARRQAYELSDSRWNDDCRKLTDVLRPIVKPARSYKISIVAVAVVALLAAGYAIKIWSNNRAETARQNREDNVEQPANKAERQADLQKEQRAREAEKQSKLENRRRVTENQTVADLEKARKPYGADTCIAGYVWREAVADDHVCVTPETRDHASRDNALSSKRRNPGVYGDDTCLQGYVWREAAAGDHVCVTVQTRDQVARDNNQAQSRVVR